MLENLIESRPKRPKTRKQLLVSFVVHVGLVFLAIRGTANALEQIRAINADTALVFLRAPEPPPPPPPEVAPPPEAIVSANPPPLGFQTVMPPTEIPKDIPPVNLNERFNAADFSGKGVEGGIAKGVLGGTGTAGPVTGETFVEAQVDDPVEIVTDSKPRYPPVLQQAGIQGFVEAQWVVDTTGRAELASFKATKSSHPQFEAPVREAIMKSVFKPARIKGQAVRQLVQRKFGFTINP